MRKIILSILGILLVAGIFFFFVFKNEKEPVYVGDKIKITASFYPYYFFVSQIGGEKIETVNITPSGAEPHDYEPTTGDIIQISSSRLLVINGLVEHWKNKVETSTKGSQVRILAAGDGLFSQDFTNEDGKRSVDPHIWLSPELNIKQVEKILDAIIEIDPENENYYKSRAKVLIQKFNQLDKEYKNTLSSCKRRDFITSHSAFGYLASEYGLNQVSIAGLSPEEEPSLKQLSETADFVKKNNIKYIFFESLASPRLAETIARETGAQTMVLNPLEGLTPEEEKEGKNYLTIMEENLHNLKIALECS